MLEIYDIVLNEERNAKITLFKSVTLSEFAGDRESLPIVGFEIIKNEKMAVNFSNLYIHFFDLLYINANDDEELNEKELSMEKFTILNSH